MRPDGANRLAVVLLALVAVGLVTTVVLASPVLWEWLAYHEATTLKGPGTFRFNPTASPVPFSRIVVVENRFTGSRFYWIYDAAGTRLAVTAVPPITTFPKPAVDARPLPRETRPELLPQR